MKKEKILIFIFGLFLGIFLGANIFISGLGFLIFKQKTNLLKQELGFWKKVAQDQPQYPDVWAKLAIIWHNLEKKDLAQKAIKKARRLDPIRKEFKTLEAQIIK